jgi:hypothetical protein
MPQGKQKSKQKAKAKQGKKATAKKPAARAKKAGKTAAKKAAKAVKKADKKAAAKAKKAGTRSAKKAGTKSAKKAGTKSAKKAGTKSAKKAGTRSAKKAGTKSAKKAGTRSAKKAGTKSAKKAGTKAAKKAGTKAAKKAGTKAAAKKAGTKSAKGKSGSKSARTKSAKQAAPRPRPVLGPASPEIMAARRFYALPIDGEAYAASEEGLTDRSGDDLVAAHLGRNFGYFGAIDKTLSGFYVLDDEGDNYYLADLRDSGQVWWQDHETREVSLRFDSVEDFAAYRDARREASDEDDDDDIAARFRPRKLKSTSERRPTTAALLERYQWLMWLFARAHELRGQVIDSDEDMARRAYGHLRAAFDDRAAEARAFAAERGRLADDPHLGIYWLLHTSVLADHARRDEVVAALASSEHPLVHAFVAGFAALAHDGDVPAAPGFRARRSLLLFFSGGAATGEEVDLERLIAALFADPVTHGFVKAERLVDTAAATDQLDRLRALVAAGPPGVELGFQALAALLDVRAGVQASPAADAVLQTMHESADLDLLGAVLEPLAPLATDRQRVRDLIDGVLARDPYHWGVLHAARAAAERDGDGARAEQIAARIAPLAEVRPLLLQLYAEDDDEREAALRKLGKLAPPQRLLLARRLLLMAGQVAGDVLAAAVEVLLSAGDSDALADLQTAAAGLKDPSEFAGQLAGLREDGIVDLADPLLPTFQALLMRPEGGGFFDDDYKEDLVEKLAPIAHEPAIFDWLLAALAEDSRHELRDKILSKLFIAYSDNQVVRRLSEGQAFRLVRLAARLGVKPAGADDDGVFPAIHVYHAAGRVLFYFNNPGGLQAFAELLGEATDEELLSNLYSGLAHIKTEPALGLLRSRLFVEQRQIWYLCNGVAETFDDAGHAEIMTELERTRSDHAANSYAVVFLDFESDTRKKPHAYVAAIARAVLGWPEPVDARARGQRKFVLMHAVRLGLESGDHELVRQAHAAAACYSRRWETHGRRHVDSPATVAALCRGGDVDAVALALYVATDGLGDEPGADDVLRRERWTRDEVSGSLARPADCDDLAIAWATEMVPGLVGLAVGGAG